jgi:hypothetical protein
LSPTDIIFEQFSSFGNYVQGSKSEDNRRIFIDNGSSILFVAHLDTVLPPMFKKQTAKRLYATGLDDRLGCLLAYELGTELQADILLTDNEEKCRSTARFHTCKDYNWIVEFDRAGNDVVTYDRDNPVFLQRLSDYWKIGVGSYSDITDLQTKVCCFNLGTGIKNGHYKSCSVDIKTLKKQLAKFRAFYAKYVDTKFVADDIPEPIYSNSVQYGAYDKHEVCELCNNDNQVELVHGYLICETCFLQLLDSQFITA